MKYLTEEVEVTGELSIWAEPKHKPEPGEFPFEYRIYSEGRPWREGSVRVNDHEITLTIPKGVNLIAAGLRTLKEEKEKRYDEYLKSIRSLDEQIERLSGFLTYQEDEDE